MKLTLGTIVTQFGKSVQEKMSNPLISGQPEDQLRSPFERLLLEMAALLKIDRITVIGESAIPELHTRPDYSVTIGTALVGFVELKAPGKGSDPRKFKDKHDKAQWKKLQSLPNLIYSDGNSFSLWQDGELVGSVISFEQDIQSFGQRLKPPQGLLDLFERFFLWHPIAPRTVKELAKISARLCRLLRDEVTDQLAQGSEALTALATDWRKLLFPDATDKRFADGYAQAVTFGLLMARAKGIELSQGFDRISGDLKVTYSLIGSALRLLTENPENQQTLKTSLKALTQVFDAVDWPTLSKGDPETWLYFYEDFLEVYDGTLRKETGSYYTPPQVVQSMVRLVDTVLKSEDFSLSQGLASPHVTIVDPAMGTGTYILGILRHIAQFICNDQGEGSIPSEINAALKRLISFELQLGPFAVAQLRILAEVITLTGQSPDQELRMFVTDTLSDPTDDAGWIPNILAPIAKSRRDANKIKREEPVTVVIGNPPYREQAKGWGGWIESGNSQIDSSAPLGNSQAAKSAPLEDWIPPRGWGLSAHAKHLRNLYIYFWRWATWKVFDCHPEQRSGIICFITMAGFLHGPGFQKMREYLRECCSQIWVIDCSPEGHQPPVNTRIFEKVQQPVCIVLASRSHHKHNGTLATVKFYALPSGSRFQKFEILDNLTLDDSQWQNCPQEGRAPFLPQSSGDWSTYPALVDFFEYHGSGVMAGRTWVIAPDKTSLEQRWNTLVQAPNDQKETLFHPHLRKGKLGDKYAGKIVPSPLANQLARPLPISQETQELLEPVPYGYRSFDRQWIIPDNRLINQPNPQLWEQHSGQQIYLTGFVEESPTQGPALTITALIPDLHHYKGSLGGRVFPLWQDADATVPNVRPQLLRALSHAYHYPVSPEAVFAYLAAIAAHPDFTQRFHHDLATPGIRIPLTADPNLFQEAVALGQRVVWLHTFGERMGDASQGRPSGPPRLPENRRPKIPKHGAIPRDPDGMPNDLSYDVQGHRLQVGQGYIDQVPEAVWKYKVSGKQTLLHWFSYRKKDRKRPVVAKRRTPSPLDDIYSDRWLPEYTSELINLLNVLGLLVDLEPQQAQLLDRICSAQTLPKTLWETSLSSQRSSSSHPPLNSNQISFNLWLS